MSAPNTRDNLTVDCGATDRNGRRHFIAKWGADELHRDVIDHDANWHRAQFGQAIFKKLEKRFSSGDVAQEQLVEMFGDDPEQPDLTWVGNLLIAAANAVEEAEDGIDDAPPVTFDTLIEQHPRLAEPIIGGILRRGGTGNLVSATKIGKSWLAYMLALCVRLGHYWLDTFPCRAGRVLLIDNELFPAEVVYRIQESASAMGIQRHEYARDLDVISLRGRLKNIFAVCKSLESIERGRYDLIIFDALYRGLPAGISENDNGAMAEIYNHIDRTTARLDCAWINVHHSSKGDQGDKRISDVGAGAGSQSRAVDAHIILREHEEQGVMVLESAVRSFKPNEPLAVRWNFPLWVPDGDIDTKALKGRLSRQEQRTNERHEKGIEAIVETLRSAGKPMTNRKVRIATELSKELVDKLLTRLERSGRVKSRDVTVKGNDCPEYWLADGSPDVVDERGHVVDCNLPRVEGRGVVAVSKEDRPPTSPHVVDSMDEKPTTSRKKKTPKTTLRVHQADDGQGGTES